MPSVPSGPGWRWLAQWRRCRRASDWRRVRCGYEWDNTGEVAYAPAGDGEWRVSGDAVNTAARLQTAAGPGTVLVGNGTALAVAEVIVIDQPIDLSLKGKEQPVRAWRAVTPLPHRSRERAMGALRAPLMGRTAEVDQLHAAVERVRLRGTEVLLVIAPPGAGKTRLVEELAAQAGNEASPARLAVLRARLRPETISPASVAAQLFVSTLDPHPGTATDGQARQRARLRVAGELLGRAVPPDRAAQLMAEVGLLLDDRRPVAQAGSSAIALAEEREIRFGAWIEALDVFAAGRPQVWLLEDLHWSGGDILAFVEQAAGRPAAGGRLVLGTARPVLLEELAQRPAGVAKLTLMELPPLGIADAHGLVRALVGDALPPEVVEALVARSDGNPLFIEELLRSWVSLGTLAPMGEGRWTLTAGVEAVALPQTVQAIYAAQLDDLPDDARTLIRRASVAGRRVPRNSLLAMDLTAIEDALAVARRRELLEDAAADMVAGPLLSFRHALLRDACYSSLSRAERARLHARLATWYQQVSGSRADDVAEQIAGHYAAAIEHSSRLSPQLDEGLTVWAARALAVEWFRRAAGRALADAAHETGRSLLRRALDHADPAQPLVRAGLLLMLGEATAYTADMEAGASLLTDSLEAHRVALDEVTGDEQRDAARSGYGAAAAALGRVWIQQIRFEDAARLADEALGRLGGGDDSTVVPLLGIRGWIRATMTMDRSAMEDIDRSLGIAERVGDRRLALEVRDWRASALGELDEFEVGEWAAIEELAVELGDWRRAVKAMRMQAGAHVDDEHDLVWPLADRAEAIARRRGQEEDMCWIDYLRSEAGLASGDWERAMDAGLRAVDRGERNSYDRVVVRTLHVLLPMATARGDREVIEHAYRWHEARKEKFPDSPYARIMEAAIALHCMDADLMERSVPEIGPRLGSFDTAPSGPSWLAAIESVIESWLAAGELPAVGDAVARMHAALAREPDPTSLGRGTVDYLRARHLAALPDQPLEAASAARAALARFRSSRAPWWIGKAVSLLRLLGEATADEAAELEQINRRLGIARVSPR